MPAVPGTPISADSPTSEASCWQTPKWLIQRIIKNVWPEGIALDPCTTEQNPLGAERFYFPPQWDGLTTDWARRVAPLQNTIFVNPPFIEGRKWAAKAVLEAREASLPRIIFLAPAAVGTEWIHALWREADDALWFSRRIRFETADGTLAGSPTRGTVLFALNCSLRGLADLGTRALVAA